MTSPTIKMSTHVHSILLKISRQLTSSVREVERSTILLELSKGLSSSEIRDSLGKNWVKVQRLRHRWLANEPKLAAIENKDASEIIHHELTLCIKDILKDAPRSGSPVKFSTQVYCQILGVSLEDPQLSGRPISEWSLTELKQEVEKRGIVSSISRSQLGDFLKSVRCEATQDERLAQSQM